MILVQVCDGGQSGVVFGAELLDLSEGHGGAVIHEASVAQQRPTGLAFPGKQTETQKRSNKTKAV